MGLNLSCWLAFTLFSFRDHTYLLRLTCGFTWKLNYTQFLTFESPLGILQPCSFSDLTIQEIPRSYNLPSVQVMSSGLNLLPAFTKHLIEFCWTRENSWNVREVWYKTVAEFMSFQAPTVFHLLSLSSSTSFAGVLLEVIEQTLI
jgi:hypothetical protein